MFTRIMKIHTLAFLFILAFAAFADAQICQLAPVRLVSWYAADGNALDSRSRLSGILQNGASFTMGQNGQAFNFTALNQHVEIPDNASLDLTNALTLEAWIAPSQFGAANQGTSIIQKGDLSTFGNQPYSLLYNSDGKIVIRVGISSTFSTSIGGTTVLPLNTFSHVVGTYDGTTAKIYVNGVLENSGNDGIGTLVTNNLPVRIGANNFAGYLGKIDEASIYNRALSVSEIAAITSAGNSGKCKPTAKTSSGLISWRLNSRVQSSRFKIQSQNKLPTLNFEP